MQGHGQVFADRGDLEETLQLVPYVDENLHKFPALISMGRLEDAEELLLGNPATAQEVSNSDRELGAQGCIAGATSIHFTKLMRAYVESDSPNHIQARAIFWRMDELGKLDPSLSPSYEAYVLLLLTRYRDMKGKKMSNKHHRKAIQNGRTKIRNIIKAMKMRGYGVNRNQSLPTAIS